jgi:hypothetical protein
MRLEDASFALIESFFRAAKKMHQVQFPERPVSREQLDQMKCAIRGPINWAADRSYCKPLDFKKAPCSSTSARMPISSWRHSVDFAVEKNVGSN